MSLDNNSANNFQDFLDAIKPYLNYQLYDMSGMGVEAFRFSTDEKPVGQWTDGKLLYAKTVDCGALPNNNTKNIAHGISNLDKVYAINGVAINSSGNSVTLPNAIKAAGECVALQSDRTNVIIITGADWSMRNGYVTMLYTKTTDSPLSSDEKFAGLTASGEVIYKKHISATSPTTNNTIENITQDVVPNNANKCWLGFGYLKNEFGTFYPLNISISATDYVTTWFRGKAIGQKVCAGDSSKLNQTVELDIYYTKTS